MLLFIIFVLPCDMQEKGFNTSHVVIYQKFTAGLDTSYSGFNTSHVVIYRRSVFPNRTNIFQFQYISCCYLSYSCCPAICRKKVSIHLMLLFIRNSQQGLIHRTQVSIHLMLLFIAVRFFPIGPIFSSFNTSHVVIYRKRNGIFKGGNMFQYISCCYLS